MEDMPTVERLSISSKFFPPKTLQSVIAAMQGLKVLYLLGPRSGPQEVRMGTVNVMENATLKVLRHVSGPALETLVVLGEANFSIGSLSRFGKLLPFSKVSRSNFAFLVRARKTTLRSIVIHDWCGPSLAHLNELKVALNPVLLQVGSVYSCTAMRENGLRNERSDASLRVMAGVLSRELKARGVGRDAVFWCVPCCAVHCAEKVDDISYATPPRLNARQRRFAPM